MPYIVWPTIDIHTPSQTVACRQIHPISVHQSQQLTHSFSVGNYPGHPTFLVHPSVAVLFAKRLKLLVNARMPIQLHLSYLFSAKAGYFVAFSLEFEGLVWYYVIPPRALKFHNLWIHTSKVVFNDGIHLGLLSLVLPTCFCCFGTYEET